MKTNQLIHVSLEEYEKCVSLFWQIKMATILKWIPGFHLFAVQGFVSDRWAAYLLKEDNSHTKHLNKRAATAQNPCLGQDFWVFLNAHPLNRKTSCQLKASFHLYSPGSNSEPQMSRCSGKIDGVKKHQTCSPCVFVATGHEISGLWFVLPFDEYVSMFLIFLSSQS